MIRKSLSQLYPSSERRLVCVCPSCRKTHKTSLFWTGKGIPRIYCVVCKNKYFNTPIIGVPKDFKDNFETNVGEEHSIGCINKIEHNLEFRSWINFWVNYEEVEEIE